MKSYVKGIITGIVLTVCIGVVPVIGDTIDVLFNQVRLNINGLDKAQWGENYTLDNGETVPYSIMYKGTTYLPLRKMGEFTNKYVAWNGDTQTVTLVDNPQNRNILAEKPDKSGNVWTYYTFQSSDKTSYLGVKDEKRGYERVYQLISDSVKVTDDKIYFLRVSDLDTSVINEWRGMDLYTIDFKNDVNTQDGTLLYHIEPHYISGAILDGEYIYYHTTAPGGNMRGVFYAVNYVTGAQINFPFKNWCYIIELELVESTDTSATLSYTEIGPGWSEKEKIIFDKPTHSITDVILESVEVLYP